MSENIAQNVRAVHLIIIFFVDNNCYNYFIQICEKTRIEAQFYDILVNIL